MGERSRAMRFRREQRQLEERRALRFVADAPKRGCLFCRLGDGGFRSVEHILGESLGNTEHILPKGVVCDRCNNGELAEVDKALAEFGPIAQFRTFFGVPNKAGKIPKLSMVRETIEHRPSDEGANPTIVVTSKIKGRSPIKEVERYPDGRTRFTMTSSGGRAFTPRLASELSRSLLKMALETAWLQYGEIVLGAPFDHIRKAVLGEVRNGYVAVARSSVPRPGKADILFDFVSQGADLRMSVSADVYGIRITTDSRLARPDPPLDEEEWFVLAFTSDELKQSRKSGPAVASAVDDGARPLTD